MSSGRSCERRVLRKPPSRVVPLINPSMSRLSTRYLSQPGIRSTGNGALAGRPVDSAVQAYAEQGDSMSTANELHDVEPSDFAFTRCAWVDASPADVYGLVSDVSSISRWSPNASGVA